MQVNQVMSNTVTWVTPDASLPDIARKMRDEDFGSVPVAEQDRLIGIVTETDIVRAFVTVTGAGVEASAGQQGAQHPHQHPG